MTNSFNIRTASQVYGDDGFLSRKAVDRAGSEFAKDPDNISIISHVQQYRRARMLALDNILDILDCVPWKGTALQRVRIPPGNCSFQPVAIGAVHGGNDMD